MKPTCRIPIDLTLVVAADVSPLHIPSEEVRADSRRLLRFIDTRCETFPRTLFSPIPVRFTDTTRTLFRGILFLAALVATTASGFAGETNAPARPASWAKPLTAAGIGNFYQVTTNLYRGAQPTAEGMKQLQAMGIKTVINLRAYHSDKDEVAGTGLKGVRFESEPWDADEKDVVGFLRVMADTNNLPAFVHCQRGADRTGMMCAMYRICIGGWTKAEAIEEMKEGGFGFNPTWHNLVRYIEKADVEKMKREAGVDSLKR